MTLRPRPLLATLLVLLLEAALTSAQTPTQSATDSSQQPDAGQSRTDATRPATTTFFGDTGLWFVPTAEVLPGGKWSVSGYRRGTNYVAGYTNVGDFAGTFGVGVGGRAEIFGSLQFDTRIDRDTEPLFFNDAKVGGVVDRYPLVHQPWTGDHLGDFYVGAKFNLISQANQAPAAAAIRAMVKIPTADKEVGNGTGKADVSFDVIASTEAKRRVEWAGYAGYEFRGKPDGFDAPNGAFRWGTGVAFPSRSIVRVNAELDGVLPSKDSIAITGEPATRLVGRNDGRLWADNTRPPTVSETENLTRATIGVTVQAPKGFFVGAGLSWNVPRQERNPALTGDTPFADYWDWQVRIGYHPGVKVYVPPPPPLPPPPAPAPAAPAEHRLTVKAQCDPCTVEVGKSSTVTAVVQDSISCAVTYAWSAPSGSLANPAARQTLWTAPLQPGSVPVTVTVTCPSDGKTASDVVTIQVVQPPKKTYTFEDVHFDFDRYSLRPEATRVLDEAVTALAAEQTLRVTIEGHTCDIGTAEYNLALGDRRARAVREYLVSRGVSGDRLQLVSYGEERPKFDNSREETRRLNRRAALVVMLER